MIIHQKFLMKTKKWKEFKCFEWKIKWKCFISNFDNNTPQLSEWIEENQKDHKKKYKEIK